jgi:hypothetical protein
MTSSPIIDFFGGTLWDSDTGRKLHHDEEANSIGGSQEEDPTNSIAANLDAFMSQFSGFPEIWPFATSVPEAHEVEVQRGRSFDRDEIKSKRSTSAPSSKTRGNGVSKKEHKDRYDISDDGVLQNVPHTAIPSIGQDTFTDLACPASHSKIPVKRVRSTPTTSRISSSGGNTIKPPRVVGAAITIPQGIDQPVRLSQRGPQGYHTDLWRLSPEGPRDIQTPETMTDCRKPSITVPSSAHATAQEVTSNDISFATENEEPNEAIKYDPIERKHLSWCGHGKLLTFISIATALTALILAYISKVSVDFAALSNPLFVSPDYRHVKTVGLNRMMLCYNETVVGGRKLRIVDDYMYGSPAANTYTVISSSSTSADASNTGCYVLGLTTENVDDLMWNVSRSFLSLAIYLGAFLTLMLATSIFWKSINLKPIAIGLLFVYFFQSLSFFFFDSNLCREHTCTLAEGSISSILSCGFWFASGIACIRMDIVYQAKLQKEDSLRRRAEREAQHANKNGRNKVMVLSETESVTTIETPVSSPMSSPSSRRVSIGDLENGEYIAGDLCPMPSRAW